MIAANDSLQADFSPDVYNNVQQMYTLPSEWTLAGRALPPRPTTRLPPPSPRTTGSPGRCSISSSRGPKGSSATVYPTLGCTCVQSPRLVYTVSLITELYQITVVSHSVHILTYCGASARSSSDLVLLHSTMQVLTRYS